MKINEVMARDKTRKDHNGNFLGFDPGREVWVVVPRNIGKSMITRGELTNGVLSVKTKYPEFQPSASPITPSQETPKSSNWIQRKGSEWQQSSVQKLKQAPAAVSQWMDKEKQAHKSTGSSYDG